MSKSRQGFGDACRAATAALSVAALGASAPYAPAVERPGRFERSYTPRGAAHFTLSNVSGDITVTAWGRRTVSVLAITESPAAIEDRVVGTDILVSVKQAAPTIRADFRIYVPANTSLSLKNVLGKINVSGVTGDIVVTSFESEVRLQDVQAASVEVRVTTGDIYFDGQLREGGAYSFQSMKGDIDLNLPGGAAFNLAARALSEKINLGEFAKGLTGVTKGAKMVSGNHLAGGPRLTVTTYDGRIVLHKK